MKKIMKKIIMVLLALCLITGMVGCSGGQKKLSVFHEKVSECQELLDAVADSIYSNWYDAIYDDEFGGDIDVAIAYAQIDHADDLERIEALDAEIATLFSEIKNDKNNSALIKDIMSAYSDYYEFVVNVSGSFNSFSANKETLKKELASLLKELSYEL